jgi:hypothetical protein
MSAQLAVFCFTNSDVKANSSEYSADVLTAAAGEPADDNRCNLYEFDN